MLCAFFNFVILTLLDSTEILGSLLFLVQFSNRRADMLTFAIAPQLLFFFQLTEYEEEVEFEEDEDERISGPKPKKRKKKNTLIDFEAEEDDQEDEDEDEDVIGLIADDDHDHEAAAASRARRDHVRLEQERTRQSEDPEALERYFRERFGDDSNYDDEGEAGAPDTSAIEQKSLLPTIHDPRLYIVKCKKPGHERRAILSLLLKSFHSRKKGIDLGIFSAVAADHLKGRVYVEALSAQHVEKALNGLDIFTTYEGVKPLRLDEMPDVLKVAKKKNKLVLHSWVRMTRGIYKGDLAQICAVPEGGIEGQVMVRMIPRLDVKSEKDAYLEDEQTEYEDLNNKNAPRRKGRPPQRLFDKKELYRLTGTMDVYAQRDQQTLEVFDVFHDDRYRFGLLYKRVSPRLLTMGEDVSPQVDEVEKWLAAESKLKMAYKDDPTSVGASEAANGLNLDLQAIGGKTGTRLFKGDSVQVVSGEQKGLSGKVYQINGDVVMIEAPDFPMKLRVDRADVLKTFSIGDNIKVTSGKYAGYTGAIVQIDRNILTIFSDATREEIRVLASQVTDVSDVNIDTMRRVDTVQGRNQYQLFDLVQLQSDRNEYGVVIQVRNDGVMILTAQNTTRMVPVSDIRGKRRDQYARAIDSRGSPIAENDTIHVISGVQKDRQGVVKHVAGTAVFFKARDETNNCGIVAVPSSDCTVSTAAGRRPMMNLRTPGINAQFKTPTPIPKGAMATNGGKPRQPMSKIKDPLYRADVKIKKGQYKGHVGKVIDITDTKVRVELTTKMKTVTVPRTQVKPINGAIADAVSSASNGGSSFTRMSSSGVPPLPTRSSGSYAGSRDNSALGRTPRVNDRFGSRTPAHPGVAYGSRTPNARFGAQTPGYAFANTPRPGGATPGRFGGATPAREAFGRTPARDPYPDYRRTPAPHTPANDGGNSFGSYDPKTPGGGVPQTPLGADYPAIEPQTPAAIPEPNTPAYGMEPTTPAPGMEPQTPAPGALEPRTPAPGLEPKTPAPGFEPSTPAPGYEPNTPAPGYEPNTPMVEPQTPHGGGVPQTPRPPEEESAGLGYRVLVGVEVLVERTHNGVVEEASVDGSRIMVRMLTGEKRGTVVQVQEITPVQPRAEVGDVYERVKVLDGPYVNRFGRLKLVEQDTGDGHIQFDNGEEAKMQMTWVAKVYEEDAS